MMEDLINKMIASSDVTLKHEDDFWFNYKNQRKHIYNLAAKLFVEFNYEPKEAVERAETFVNLFYNKIIQKSR